MKVTPKFTSPKIWLQRALVLVLFAVLWQVVYYLEIWPKWIFPDVPSILTVFIEGIVSGEYFVAISVSMQRLAIGFVIALIIGTLIGIVTGKNKLASNTIGYFVLGLQTLPSICWLPLAILLFGLNEVAIIFVVVMGAVLSVTIAVDNAIKEIPRRIIQAGKLLGCKRWTLIWYVILPAILPMYVSGLKQAWSFAWRSLMAGELLFITAGLGQILMLGRELNDMAQVLSVMLVIICLGIAIDTFVFGVADRYLRRRWYGI